MSQKIFGIDPQGRTAVAGSKRNSGFIAEGVDYDKLNQLLFELRADHIIGDATQLSNNDCTCVFQSSDQTFRDSQGALVTFANGEKIIWAGLDTITASIDISTIDDLTHETLTGVTIVLGTYDLDLGENQRGELNLSGSGTLTVLSSSGLFVVSGGVAVDNQDGIAIVDDNVIFQDDNGLDFSAGDKGIFKGLQSIVYRLRVDVVNNDDPLGSGGNEWTPSNTTDPGSTGTPMEFKLGGLTVIKDSPANGLFQFTSTGHWLMIARIIGTNPAGSSGVITCEIQGTNDYTTGPTWATLADIPYTVTNTTNSRSNATGFALLQIVDTDEDIVKIEYVTNIPTAVVNGVDGKNETSILFVKLADL